MITCVTVAISRMSNVVHIHRHVNIAKVINNAKQNPT